MEDPRYRPDATRQVPARQERQRRRDADPFASQRQAAVLNRSDRFARATAARFKPRPFSSGAILFHRRPVLPTINTVEPRNAQRPRRNPYVDRIPFVKAAEITA